MRRPASTCRATLLALAVLLGGCQSAPERAEVDETPMSVADAQALAARFKSLDTRAPPRSIADIREMLGPEKQRDGSCAFEREWRAQELAQVIAAVGETNSYKAAGRLAQGVRVVHTAERMASVGEIREALDLLERATGARVARDPRTSTAWAHRSSRSRKFSAVNHQTRLMGYATLAQLMSVTGDVAGAEASRRGALSQLSATGGYGNPAEMRAYAALAEASAEQAAGRLPQAEAHYREVIAMTAWSFALAGGIDLAWAGSRLSANLLQQGRMFEAELEARKTLRGAIDNYRGMPIAANIGLPAMQLGAALLAQGRPEDAEFMARRAINFFEVDCAEAGSLTLALARRTLIWVLAAKGDWQGVEAEVDRARKALADDPEAFERIYGSDPEVWLAEVLAGRTAAGLGRLEALVTRLSAERGEDDDAALEARGFLGLAQRASGDPLLGLETLRASARSYLEGRRALGQAGKSGATGRMRIVIAGYGELLGDLAADGGPERAAYVDEHFRVAQLLRLGRVQRAYDAAAARAAAGTPELAEMVRRTQDAEQESAAIVEVLNFTVMSPSGQVERTHEQALRERLAELRRARVVLEDEIDRRFPAYRDLLRPRPLSIADAQRALRPGEALVVFQVDRDESWVWAVPDAGPVEYAALGVGADALDEWVLTLREGLDPTGAETLGDIARYNVDAAHGLFEAALAPVARGWQGARHLLVVTDGALGQLPLAVLPTVRPGALAPDGRLLFAQYRDVAWLSRTHAISVLPAVPALSAMDRPKGRVDARGEAFAGFGDPIFDPAPQRSAGATRAGSARAGSAARVRSLPVAVRAAPATRSARSADLSDLPALPETAEEVRAVAAALGASPESVFLGAEASEENAKQARNRTARVILMATHGLVPGDIDGLGQPALAMSAPAVTGGGGDGLLTLDEILALELDADWVILSACNTGAADGEGAEAISGLGRAFFYAGARALLVSNWPVHSEATKELTTAMVDRTATTGGRSRAEMHRAAMTAMVDEGVYRDGAGTAVFSYAHPVFWAPFSVVGDGRGAMR